MQKYGSLIVIVCFFLSDHGFADNGLVKNLEKLAGIYEGKQILKRGIEIQEREIILEINHDGTGKLKVSKVNFDEWVIWSKDLDIMAEVREGILKISKVTRSSNGETAGTLKYFEILEGGKFLKIEPWTGGTERQSLKYGVVLLEKN